MSLKQKKIKFKPSIKLNHNICAMIRSSLTKLLECWTWNPDFPNRTLALDIIDSTVNEVEIFDCT